MNPITCIINRYDPICQRPEPKFVGDNQAFIGNLAFKAIYIETDLVLDNELSISESRGLFLCSLLNRGQLSKYAGKY